MKVILLKDVKNLGRKFDLKEVASGHALNFLIPRGEAIAATPTALRQYEKEKARLEGERKVHEELAMKNLKSLNGTTLTVVGRTNAKGHLFAGLHKEAIVGELFKQTQIQIDPAFLELANPIKESGEHQIQVKVGDKTATFKLVVKGE